MKIVKKHADGSQSVIFERGDRVRITRIAAEHRNSSMSVGDIVTVTGWDNRWGVEPEQGLISRVFIKTDDSGSRRLVFPWTLEKYGE